MEHAGRWSLLQGPLDFGDENETLERMEIIARVYLKRYGVVFRKLVAGEEFAPPWRDLVRIYRRMEARGEIRGGIFMEGVYGEQFCLPEALSQLRSTRKAAKTGELITLSAADPFEFNRITYARKTHSTFGLKTESSSKTEFPLPSWKGKRYNS